MFVLRVEWSEEAKMSEMSSPLVSLMGEYHVGECALASVRMRFVDLDV